MHMARRLALRTYTARAVYRTYTYLRVLILTRFLRPLRNHAAAQAHVLEFTVNREHEAVAVRYSCTAVLDWYGSTGTYVYCTCIPVQSHSLRYLPADRAGHCLMSSEQE